MRTDEQTDMHDEANSRFSQLCERANKVNIKIFYIPIILFLFHTVWNLSYPFSAYFSVWRMFQEESFMLPHNVP